MLIKKIDKLVLVPFIGLFILTLGIAIFIMLMQFFLIFFDELIGKDLGYSMYLQLFFYFGITATPKAFPLATLLASLIAFGNLGESAELTALKSAGTSLLRIILPLLIFVGLLSVFVFFSNGYLVPKVTSKAYSLLYDLRKKKPSIAIKAGIFYNGIPDYSIRVEKKLPDQKTLLDIIIYDHSKNKGNIAVTTAESGQLYTTPDNRYLVVELFNGHVYLEEPVEGPATKPQEAVIPSFYRTSFKVQKLLLDLDAFKLTRSDKDLFSYYHTTKNARQLQAKINELKATIGAAKQSLLLDLQQPWSLSAQEAATKVPDNPETLADSNNIIALQAAARLQAPDQALLSKDRMPTQASSTQSADAQDQLSALTEKALSQAKDTSHKLAIKARDLSRENKELAEYEIEKHKRMASAIGCMIMLLIGAPLGALIKKGGLGIPLLIATVFILLYYMADMFGTRWAKAGLVDSITGAWASNFILLPFGLFFLRQAQKDSRLLDRDAYAILLARVLKYIRKS